MAAFSQAVQKTPRRPLAVVTLGPADWSDTWPDRPATSVAVGLSAFSEQNALTCLGEGVKCADELLPKASHFDADWIDARNEALMLWAVTLSLCDAADPGKTYLASQDDQSVAMAFRPETIRHLWDELERATIARSPVRNPATDQELATLAELLTSANVDKLVDGQALRLRKLASYMLDELLIVAEVGDEEEEAATLP